MTTYAWHVHHTDRLVEPLTEPIEVRQTYIRAYKPAAERELRLRLLQPVKGKLPAAYDRVGAAYDRAGAAYLRAQAAVARAWDARYRARAALDLNRAGAAYARARAALDLNRAGAAYARAEDAYARAEDAYYRARAALGRAYTANLPAIEALHAVECPDCPWDGKTIFPKAVT